MRAREIPGLLRRSAWPWRIVALLLTALAAWLPLAPSLLPLLSLEGLQELGEERIRTLFLRTTWMAAAASALAMLVGGPLALLANRSRAPLAGLAAVLLPLPLFLPPLLIAQAWHGLTGMDGIHAAWFAMGLCCAPVPALLVGHALKRQSASAHEAALLLGGRRLALGEMLRCGSTACFLGGALAFVLTASDFAVPDYFSAVGEENFHVYAFEIFNRFRSISLGGAAAGGAASEMTEEPSEAMQAGLEGAAAVAAPLVLLAAAVLWWTLAWRDRLAASEGSTSAPGPLPLGRGRWPAAGALLLLLGLTVLLPLGRIVYETGITGPTLDVPWGQRAGEAFRDAAERGRGPMARSLEIGAQAALLVAFLAPVWAHALLGNRHRLLKRLLCVLLALPLLTPSVALGIGAILQFNQPELRDFYSSSWMPSLVLAGRFLPLAVFVLLDRLERVPAAREEAALLAGASYAQRLFRYRLGKQHGAWLLACGLVAVFSMRELDLAILLPAANPTAVVRYYNALHFARDNFVAAFGLLFAVILFLPAMLHAAGRVLLAKEEA